MLKKNSLGAALAVIALGLGTSAAAQTNACTAGVSVIHVNGVFTNAAEAAANSSALARAVGVTTTPDGKPIRFFAVNVPTNGLGDIGEVIDQWFEEGPLRRAFRPYAAQLTAAFFSGVLQGVGLGLRVPQSVIDEMQEFVAARVRNFMTASAARNNAVAESLKNTIETAVQQGDKVVLVPHSQGNFVTNDALATVQSTQLAYTGVIGVAVPASSVGTSAQGYRAHITRGPRGALLEGDLIINPIPTSMSANTFGPLCLSSAGHNFVDCYLRPEADSRTRIVGHVNSAISTLQHPTGIIGRGVIVATLRWGSQPDVDLHVFEPGGSHVYYAARTGTSGFLDRDDVDGFGPENYTVCNANQVQPGTYSVGVNYYSGSAPETASVKITAGTVSPAPFTRTLTTARGSSGNSSPLGVASIIVTRENGRLHFDVR